MAIEWVSTAIAAKALDISTDTLKGWKDRGFFKAGKHYRDISLGKRKPTYRWNVKAIEERLNKIFSKIEGS